MFYSQRNTKFYTGAFKFLPITCQMQMHLQLINVERREWQLMNYVKTINDFRGVKLLQYVVTNPLVPAPLANFLMAWRTCGASPASQCVC